MGLDLDVGGGLELGGGLDLDISVGADLSAGIDIDTGAMLDINLGIEAAPQLAIDSGLGGDLDSLDLTPDLDIGTDLPLYDSFDSALDPVIALEQGVTPVEVEPYLVTAINNIGTTAVENMVSQETAALNSPEPLLYDPNVWEATPHDTESDFTDSTTETSPFWLEAEPELEVDEVAAETSESVVAPLPIETSLSGNEGLAAGEIVFGDLLKKEGVAEDEIGFLSLPGEETGRPFVDTLRFATTETGETLVHSLRTFPATQTTEAEVATADSLQTYLDIRTGGERKPIPHLNIGWLQRPYNYELEWREDSGSTVFPKNVEVAIRQRFDVLWKAAAQPNNPITLDSPYSGTRDDAHVRKTVHEALDSVPPPAPEPYITYTYN